MLGTPIEPSRICLGAGPFGSDLSKADSFAVLDAFAAAGGNFFDSAHIYAAWLPDGVGASERTLGEWIRANGLRGRVVIGTKGGHPPLDNLSLGRCSRDDLEQDLNESLHRLGVDAIDLYWLHRDDPALPADAIVETLAGFVRDGRIHAYGASNWSIPRLEEANAYAAAHGLPPFVASQPGYSLAVLPPGTYAGSGMLFIDDAHHAWHARTGFPAVAYSSQARGFFGEANAAWAKSGFAGPCLRAPEYDIPVNRMRLSRAVELAGRKDCTANQIALAWLLHQPFPVYPIVGTGVPRRIAEIMGALDVSLSPEETSWLAARA